MQITPGLPMMPYVARPTEPVSSPVPGASAAQPGVVSASAAVSTNPAGPERPLTANSVTATGESEKAFGAASSTSHAKGTQSTGQDTSADKAKAETAGSTEEPEQATASKKPNGEALTEQELSELKQLKTTDREVRQHELAHQTVGGQYAGGASYTFERGVDGNRYAVAGEVPIDYGPVLGDPQATIEKMRQVRAAALAPAEPSAKDLQVAAQASQYMMAAQLELALQRADASPDRQGASTEASNEPKAMASRSSEVNQAYGQQAQPDSELSSPEFGI